jgi:hypothetical protein
MTSPTAPEPAEFAIADDDYDELAQAESATPSDGGTSQAAGTEPAATTDESGSTPTASPAAPTGATTPQQQKAPTAAWSAPTEGEPFTYRVDRRERKVDGALRLADGSVYLPAGAWEKQVAPFLADRQAILSKEQGYRQQIAEAQRRQSGETQKAQALLAEIAKIDAGGAEAWAQWLDNYHVNRPLLEERARARMLEAERDQLRSGTEEQTLAQEAQALIPELQTHLGDTLEAMLEGPEVKGLLSDDEAVELLKDLWDRADRLYYEVGEGDPSGLAPGQIGFRQDVLQQMVDRELGRARKRRDELARLEAAAKHNAATTTPAAGTVNGAATRPKPKAAPAAGKARGKKESYRDWAHRLDNEDWTDALE